VFKKTALARLLVFAMLEVGVLAGVPMTPEQIDKLMNIMHCTKIEHVVKKDDPPQPGDVR
jgi:hypothetical protein